MGDWLAMMLALAVIGLPLAIAWWLISRQDDVRRRHR
jgi:hypothetical protein